MNINLSTPMTFYELLAIILGAIGILIPIIQIVWKKWIVKTKLNFLPTGRVYLFFNQSGPYLRIDGVYEAENKSTSIKDISLKITRCRDEKVLNLSWSSFVSPINQMMVNSIVQTTEVAHPFKIESNNLVCAFIEFCDFSNSYNRTFKVKTENLFNSMNEIKRKYANYVDAYKEYKNSEEYSAAKEEIKKYFFWEIGEYDLQIKVKYGNQIKNFQYKINLGENDYRLLYGNIDESLLSPLKILYGEKLEYYTANIKI